MIKNVPIGTYAIIGTMCVEFENVMKSTTKKIKIKKMFPDGGKKMVKLSLLDIF